MCTVRTIFLVSAWHIDRMSVFFCAKDFSFAFDDFLSSYSFFLIMAAKDFNNFLHVHLIEESTHKDYTSR